MEDTLEKIGIVKHIELEVNTTRENFLYLLGESSDRGDTGIMSSSFEVFKASKNDYIGEWTKDGFSIRKRRRFFDVYSYLAVAKGKIEDLDDGILLKMKISSFHFLFAVYYAIITLMYLVFVLLIIFGPLRNAPWFVFPIMLIHGGLMFGLPYFLLQAATTKLTREFERDLSYLLTQQGY